MSGVEIPAIIGVVAAVAGTAVSVVGAEQSASAQRQSAAYQAQVAANNQQMANTFAQQSAQQGEAQAAQVEQKTRAVAGSITAAQAANNIDVNTGSALDVKTGAAETGQLDALTIRSNAARAAYGFQTKAWTTPPTLPCFSRNLSKRSSPATLERRAHCSAARQAALRTTTGSIRRADLVRRAIRRRPTTVRSGRLRPAPAAARCSNGARPQHSPTRRPHQPAIIMAREWRSTTFP